MSVLPVSVPFVPLLPAAPLVGFCGSRALSATFAPLVGAVVGAVLRGGRAVVVGCAAGADAFVRVAAPGSLVFAASAPAFVRLPPAARLAARSAALVRACAGAGAGSALVAFVAARCPVGVAPSRAWCSSGSGSWASLALAVGLGLPVLVFWCVSSAPVLPGWGGAWVPAAACGVWASAWRFVPAVQVALF